MPAETPHDEEPDLAALIARSQKLREKAEKLVGEMEEVEKLIEQVKKAQGMAPPHTVA